MLPRAQFTYEPLGDEEMMTINCGGDLHRYLMVPGNSVRLKNQLPSIRPARPDIVLIRTIKDVL